MLIGPGTYQERIHIAKSLRLIGASRELVLIKADRAIDVTNTERRPMQVSLSDLTVEARQLGISVGLGLPRWAFLL